MLAYPMAFPTDKDRMDIVATLSLRKLERTGEGSIKKVG
jgi:hypothetical protein